MANHDTDRRALEEARATYSVDPTATTRALPGLTDDTAQLGLGIAPVPIASRPPSTVPAALTAPPSGLNAVKPLTLRYDAGLPYQRDAIAAVVDLFASQPLGESTLATTFNAGPLNLTEFGTANQLTIDDDTLHRNLVLVQERNGIEPPATHLDGRDFGVEMETGTGKTYVYLRTAFELNKTYGFTKFVIVVPSIAVREGVLHSLTTMRDHFKALYAVPFESFVYDGKRPGQLGAFARATAMQLMVINIQAFQRDANVMYAEQDRLSGYRPIDFLQSTNPVVFVDEPQTTASGDASKAAIANLNPLCTLRYSATYDDVPKVYRLGPVEAYDQKLVKRIAVLSVTEDAPDLNAPFVRLHKLDVPKRTATLEFNVDRGVRDGRVKKAVKPGVDLHFLSGGRQEYEHGWIVDELNAEVPGAEFLSFVNGVRVGLNQEIGGVQDDVMRAQVRETIRVHLERERELRPRGLKVISLLFIDKVANYRVYPDADSSPLPLGEGPGVSANPALGKIGRWFEEEFADLAADPRYRGIIADPVDRIHGGYFSRDKKGGFRDSTEKGSKDDDDAYSLIMRDKERLLSLDEPLRFIFSHSALREGWDNPNVFQICTLNETRSTMRKRQEIGRGLRLPVDQSGERIRDEQVNRLTVVANEAYKDFAAKLQTEYEQDLRTPFGVVPRNAFVDLAFPVPDDARVEDPLTGDMVRPAPAPIGLDASRTIWTYLLGNGILDGEGKVRPKFRPNDLFFELDVPAQFVPLRAAVTDALARYVFETRISDARERRTVRLNKQVLANDEFRELWETISPRTRYRVAFDTDRLIESVVHELKSQLPVQPIKLKLDTAELRPDLAGVGVRELRSRYSTVERQHQIPDVLAYLANETRLTRLTIAHIINRSGRAEALRVNPQAFITQVAGAINRVLGRVVVHGIQYRRIDGVSWELSQLEEDGGLTATLDRLYEVQAKDKTPHDHIAFDSQVERQFARECDLAEDVRFYVKLPSWFIVSTPVGNYNPDWAIRFENRLIFVRETKGTLDRHELRGAENDKISCAEEHFRTLGVNFGVATNLATARILNRSTTASLPASTTSN